MKSKCETRCGGFDFTTEKMRNGKRMSPETVVGSEGLALARAGVMGRSSDEGDSESGIGTVGESSSGRTVSTESERDCPEGSVSSNAEATSFTPPFETISSGGGLGVGRSSNAGIIAISGVTGDTSGTTFVDCCFAKEEGLGVLRSFGSMSSSGFRRSFGSFDRPSRSIM